MIITGDNIKNSYPWCLGDKNYIQISNNDKHVDDQVEMKNNDNSDEIKVDEPIIFVPDNEVGDLENDIKLSKLQQTQQDSIEKGCTGTFT